MSQGPEFWVKIHQRNLSGGGSEDKASARSAGDPGSIPGSGRSPREGNGYPLQYSRLENSMDRGAWWATVHGVEKSWTGLSDFHFSFHPRVHSYRTGWESGIVRKSEHVGGWGREVM